MKRAIIALIILVLALACLPATAQNWAGAVLGMSSSNPNAKGASDREYGNTQIIPVANPGRTFLDSPVTIVVDNSCPPEIAQYLQTQGPIGIKIKRGAPVAGDYMIRKIEKTITGTNNRRSSSSNRSSSSYSSNGRKYAYSDSHSNSSSSGNSGESQTVYSEVTLELVKVIKGGEEIVATSPIMTGSNTESVGGESRSSVSGDNSSYSRSRRSGSYSSSNSNYSSSSEEWSNDKGVSAEVQYRQLANSKNFQAFTYLMQGWKDAIDLEKYFKAKQNQKYTAPPKEEQKTTITIQEVE